MLRWNGSELSAAYDSARVGGRTFGPLEPATLIGIGGVLEHIASTLAHLGIKPEIRIRTPLEAERYFAVRLDGAALPLTWDRYADAPALLRHTNRWAFRADPLAPGLLDFVENQREGAARAMVVLERDGIRHISDLVTSASQIRFQTEEVHRWLGTSLRFSMDEVDRGDGLDVRTLDLPPGGRLFLRLISDWRRLAPLNRLGVHRLLAAIDAAPVAAAPALVTVVGRKDPAGCLDAGRLLTRVWTELNRLGLGVHPYYVVSDQIHRVRTGGIPSHLTDQARVLAEQGASVFGFGSDETLHMILRVGHPGGTPPRSRRLPVEMVYSEIPDPESDFR